MPTTQPTELPITEMLEEYILDLQKKRGEVYHFTAGFIIGMLEEVSSLEQSQIQKAKEDERDRIVLLIEEMKDEGYDYDNILNILKSRITNHQ